MKIPNSKSQITNKLQIPISNRFRIWILGFVWNLVLGNWSLITRKTKIYSIRQTTTKRIYIPIYQRGFTMFEAIVVIMIVTLLSAVVLASFSGISQGGALNRAARELALSIRESQNAALSVKGIITEGGAAQVAPAVGVQLEVNKTSVFQFADLVGGTAGKLDAGEKIVQGQRSFDRGIKIEALYDQKDPRTDFNALNIVFYAPEANIKFYQTDGTELDGSTQIIYAELSAPNGQKKKVGIWKSGQISLQ